MVTADFIECFDAKSLNMDGSNFLCHTAQRVSSADSATWAAWISAIATLGLFLFAFMAWRVSRSSLTKMQSQIDTAENRVIAERQQTYFVDYWLSVIRFSDAVFDKNQELSAVQREMFLKWQIWSLDLYRADPEFRKLSSQWHSYWISESDRIRAEEKRLNSTLNEGGITMNHEVEPKAVENLTKSIENFEIDLTRYMRKLQQWQAVATSRKDVVNSLVKGLQVVENRRLVSSPDFSTGQS